MDTNKLDIKLSQYNVYDGYMYQATPKQHLKLNSWKNLATLRLSWKKGVTFFKKACIWLANGSNTNLGKENCKQGFDFCAKTKQSNKIDCGNNQTTERRQNWIRIFYVTSE